jgi:hypothetical protein
MEGEDKTDVGAPESAGAKPISALKVVYCGGTSCFGFPSKLVLSSYIIEFDVHISFLRKVYFSYIPINCCSFS